MLAGGSDEAVEGHHFGEPPGLGVKTYLGQDGVQSQAQPGVMADVDGAGFAGLADLDLIGQDPEGRGGVGVPAWPAPARPLRHLCRQRLGLGVGPEAGLARGRRLDALGQPQPGGAGSGGEGAERTEDPMARPLGGANGFDEEVLGVGFTSDRLARRFDEHKRHISQFNNI